MFGRVAKIPIGNTRNELVAMDFADYADCPDVPAHSGHFSKFPGYYFYVGQKERWANGENGSRKVIANWLAAFVDATNYRRG